MNSQRSGRRSIAPLQLQLFEIALAAVALYLAIHLGSKVAPFLITPAALVGGMAVVTEGPLGIVRRIPPALNVAVLALIGAVMAITPIVFHDARSASAVLALEGGTALIACTIVAVLRRRRPIASVPLRTEASPPPSSGAVPSTQSALRVAGRLTGKARARVSAEVPVAARRGGTDHRIETHPRRLTGPPSTARQR